MSSTARPRSSPLRLRCRQCIRGLGDQGGTMKARFGTESADHERQDPPPAHRRVGTVDDLGPRRIEAGNGRSGSDGLAAADSDGVRLQQLRGLLPCEVTVQRGSHPLCGERLSALSFQRKGGELRLVVVLPDGTPGMIAAADTDIFGDPLPGAAAETALSVEGVRRFRMLVESQLGRGRKTWRPRPWKAVRHRPKVDPFHQILELYSAHTTEQAALRALDRAGLR